MHAYTLALWHHSEESPCPGNRWTATHQPNQLATCHCRALFHTSPLSLNASVQWDFHFLHHAETSWSYVQFSTRRASAIQMGPGAHFLSQAQWEIANFWGFRGARHVCSPSYLSCGTCHMRLCSHGWIVYFPCDGPPWSFKMTGIVWLERVCPILLFSKAKVQ